MPIARATSRLRTTRDSTETESQASASENAMLIR